MTSQSIPAEDSLTELSPSEYLLRLGQARDERHDLATAALMLAALDHPEKKLKSFRAHLAELAEAVRAEADFARNAESAAQALSSVIAGRYGYEGERSDYDDPRNADLMSVIERRRGLPVALGILYMHAARASRMEACGLFAPGHFLFRIGVRGSEAVIDPFNNGAVLDRERMNTPRFGAAVHLPESGSTDRIDAFSPVSDSEVLLRLQNNIKNRAIKTRDTARAIEILRRMTLISPRRSVLWLELGRLQESTGALSAARKAYESCLRLLPSGDEISNEAAFALQALKRRLN
jgi:regulator of sirC expression with transglutaminase-like and TPR domain